MLDILAQFKITGYFRYVYDILVQKLTPIEIYMNLLT